MRCYPCSLVCLFAWLWALTVSAADGRTWEVFLKRHARAPADAPDALVHLPPGFGTEQPFDLVVFLHGFDGCSRALVAPEPVACARGERPHRVWNLGALHDASHTQTVLIVPQLAYLARTAQDHRFRERGAFDAMLREIFEDKLASQLGAGAMPRVRSIALVAHSAGYGAAAAILRDPERKVRVTHLVLLDALYAGASTFAAWANGDEGTRIISLHTQQAKTREGNRLLMRALGAGEVAREVGDYSPHALRQHRHLVAEVRTAHGDMPKAHFSQILHALFSPG